MKRKIAGFYMKRFYALDNFSAFRVVLDGIDFMTSEHAYQYYKFVFTDEQIRKMGEEELKTVAAIREKILNARSAHDAKKIGREFAELRNPEWESVKHATMEMILNAKYDQHEYVRLTIERTVGLAIVETSPIDPEWGWGRKKDGENLLGFLWMKIRFQRIGDPVLDYREAA